MSGTEGVYRRLSAAKNAGKQLSTNIFCGTGFYKRQEKKIAKRKKDDLSLAIGEKYIKKMFLFFSSNILFMDVFTYRLTVRNLIKLATEKGDKKIPAIIPSSTFYLAFTGIRLIHSSLTATRSISE